MSVHTLVKERLKFVLLVLVFSTFVLFVLTLTNYRATYAVSSLAMRTSISEADVTFVTEEAGDSDAGYITANAGDINNDGIDDLLIGAYRSDYESQADRGQVYLFFGKASGWSSSIDLSTADASFVGEGAGDYAGKGISGAGDLNGDGIDDIVIGAQNADNGASYTDCGKVYIIFGKASGWAMRQNLSTANVIIYGLDNSRFGTYISLIGDINNDDIDDLVVGTNSLNTTGTAYIYFGRTSGWTAKSRYDSLTSASIKGSGSTTTGFSGVLGKLGDVNGDTIDDFALGWASNPTNKGSFYVYFGKASGWGTDQDGVAVSDAWYYSNVADSIIPSSSITGGDVNGDDLNDIIVGAQSDDTSASNAGRTYVIFGKSSGWTKNAAIQTSSDASLLGESASDLSGLYASGEGDINGDGIKDIFVTAYGDDDGGADAGQIYIVYGKASGWTTNQNLSSANASFVGNIASGNLGSFSSSTSGDFNGDGANDILTGAAGVGGQERAYLIFGTPATLNTPSLVSSTPLSSTSIRWNVTDNTTVEDGIRIYDESGALKVECPGENLTYCDETGLSANTAYIRKATAYNTSEESAFSATSTGVTLANVPDTPVMGDGNNKVTVVPGTNPSHTEFLIYEPNLNKYVNKTTGALDSTASWGTYAEFGGENGITLTGLGYSTGYDLQVKARNSNNVETDYSATAHLVSTPRPLGEFAMRTSISTADASFLTEASGSYLGDYVTNVGDVNDDGYDDVAVGAYYSGYGGVTGRGQVYLFFGKASGWSIDKSVSEADASFMGEGSGDLAGLSIDKAGDINDDGIDDIIIGAMYNDAGGSDAGQAYIIFGKASGWTMRQNLSTADASIRGAGGYRIGASVNGVGDINNDGIDDIVVGATGAGSTGTAFLYFGKASGWSMGQSYNTANASFVGSGSGSFFPSAVAGLGDVNGDTIDDLAIGWTGDTTYGVNTGRVFILFGKASGWALGQVTANVSNASYYSNVSGYTLPFDLSGGDINGDGLNDILISTQNDDTVGSKAGKTHIIFGKSSGWANNQSIATANASIVGESASDYSSRSASAESDVNGDGIKDIVIGAYGDDDGGNSAGQIYIVYGKSSGWTTNQSLSTANASFVGNIASGQLGYSLSAGGDFNNDGGGDILVGAPGGGADERAYVIFGSPPPFNAPTLVSGTVQSSTTIRWNITDNTTLEDGVKIYDENNVLKVECAGENLTYCDETGLTPNTSYTRKATAYNTTQETGYSDTATVVTLANVPGTPTISGREITILPNSNPASTQYVIYEPSLSKYVDKATGSLTDSESWGTYEEFGGDGGFEIVGLAPGTSIELQVKARNSENVETAYSSTATLTVQALPTVTLSSSAASFSENNGSITVTATLSEAYESEVTVNLALGGSAIQGTDYSISSTSIAIPIGGTTGSTTISSINDSIYEGADENITVDIDSVTNGQESGTQQITLTIDDDESTPTVSIALNHTTVSENSGSVTLTASLSNKTISDVIVQLALSGTAEQDTNYTVTGTTITIPANNLEGSITVNGIDNDVYQGDKTVIFDISDVTNATENGTQQRTLTVQDDESTPTVSIELSDSSISENNEASLLFATLSGKSALNTTVNIAFTGTATKDTDYESAANSIVIPAGELTAGVLINAITDSIYEGNETVIADVSSVTNALENGTQRVTLTIEEDDPVPTVSFALNNTSISENGGSSTLTATLSAAAGADVTVNLGVSGSAVSGVDFALSSSKITITAGNLTGTALIQATNDSIYEGDENVIIDMTSVTNALENGTQNVTLSIKEDEVYPTVTLSLNNASISENGGKGTLTLTTNVKSSKDITGTLSFSGTASSGDYSKSASTIVIKAGALTGTAVITAVNDSTDESDESVIVEVSSVENATKVGTPKATLLIIDDDETAVVNPPVTEPEEEEPVTPPVVEPEKPPVTPPSTNDPTPVVNESDKVSVGGQDVVVGDIVFEEDDMEFPQDVVPVSENDGIEVEAVIPGDNGTVKTNKALKKSTLHLSNVSSIRISVPVSTLESDKENVNIQKVLVEIGDATQEAIKNETGTHYIVDVKVDGVKGSRTVMAKIIALYDNNEQAVKGMHFIIEGGEGESILNNKLVIIGAGFLVGCAIIFILVKHSRPKEDTPSRYSEKIMY